jgi:hypothetical protein
VPRPPGLDGLADLTKALAGLARLPSQIDSLVAVLADTTGVLVRLETVVGELATTVKSLESTLETTLVGSVGGGMNDRLEHLDSVVSELGEVLTNLIGAIPGARRALRRTSGS